MTESLQELGKLFLYSLCRVCQQIYRKYVTFSEEIYLVVGMVSLDHNHCYYLIKSPELSSLFLCAPQNIFVSLEIASQLSYWHLVQLAISHS